MAMHLARDLSGMSCKDLGGYFGSVPVLRLPCAASIWPKVGKRHEIKGTKEQA